MIIFDGDDLSFTCTVYMIILSPSGLASRTGCRLSTADRQLAHCGEQRHWSVLE